VAGQRPATARQRREVFPERRVQPFDVRRIDHPAALRATPERLDACRRAIDNATLRVDDTPTLVAFDDFAYEYILAHVITCGGMHVHAVLSSQEDSILSMTEEKMSRWPHRPDV